MNAKPDTPDYFDTTDYRARAFVCGTRYHDKLKKNAPVAGAFNSQFLEHPWVRQSLSECWDGELRAALVFAVKQRIFSEQPYHDIEQLMPPKSWVEKTRAAAERYRAAAKWRSEVCATHGTVDRWLAAKNSGPAAA